MQRNLNMLDWKRDVIMSAYKRAIPVISFPSVQQLGCTVNEMIHSSDLQARGMKLIADETPSLASLSMMNLTVEAECFGSEVKYADDQIPATMGGIVKTMEDAENLKMPKVGDGLTQVYIDAAKKAAELITDRPVFADTIGPLTLAGRLIGITELMKMMKKKPDVVKVVLEKATQFLIEYTKAFKEQTGCHGWVMAEPTTGLLSNKQNLEFSEPYSKRVIEACQDNYFICIFHNCGPTVVEQAESLTRLGAQGYHFGNAIQMTSMLPLLPKDRLVMGNINPAADICLEEPETVKQNVKALMETCSIYPNFVLSTGCDVAPIAKWDNIHAFYEALDEFYTSRGVVYEREAASRKVFGGEAE